MARTKQAAPTDDGAADPAPVQGELIIPPTERQSRLIPAQDTPLAQCPSNIDQSTRAGRAIAFNAVSSADLDLGPNGEIQLDVHHWIVHWRHTIDEETGKPKSYPVLVIVTPQGDCAAFASEGVLHRWADLLATEGPGPWDQPMSVIVRSRTSRRSKRTWHELLMVV